MGDALEGQCTAVTPARATYPPTPAVKGLAEQHSGESLLKVMYSFQFLGSPLLHLLLGLNGSVESSVYRA